MGLRDGLRDTPAHTLASAHTSYVQQILNLSRDEARTCVTHGRENLVREHACSAWNAACYALSTQRWLLDLPFTFFT